MSKRIIFATNNEHKLKEVQAMLGSHFHLISLKEAEIDADIPENQDTLQGNALEKAEFVFEKTGFPCFADDTGLEVAALNNRPGVHSARYAGLLSDFPSEEARSQANMDKLLGELNDKSNRVARFRTVIAYIDGKDHFFFEGIVNGHISETRSGNAGFGYDPIFVPEGFSKSFAEMDLSEKNTISHRARAFAKFIDFIKQQ
jgi:XTP/dITP diphosphohydrolase